MWSSLHKFQDDNRKFHFSFLVMLLYDLLWLTVCTLIGMIHFSIWSVQTVNNLGSAFTVLLRQRIKCSKLCHFYLSSFDHSSPSYILWLSLIYEKVPSVLTKSLEGKCILKRIVCRWRIKSAFTYIFLIVLFCYRYIIMPHVAYRLSLNLLSDDAWQRSVRAVCSQPFVFCAC